MDSVCQNMDKLRIIVETTLSWISALPDVPIRYAKEDRLPVNTAPRTLLEFGFHREGSGTLLEVQDRRAWSVPNTLVVLNAHFGNRGTPRRSWAYWCVSVDSREGFPHPEWLEEPLLLTAPVRHPARLTAHYEAVGRQYAWQAGAHRWQGPGTRRLGAACRGRPRAGRYRTTERSQFDGR